MKAAAGRITQAKQVAPDLPAIDMALVQDLTSAMYWDIISGALSECVTDCALTRRRHPRLGWQWKSV